MNSCPECGAKLLVAGGGRFCGTCLLSSALPAADEVADSTTGDLSSLFSKTASPLGVKFHYVGDYELLEEIGRGGMGVVFRARQASLNRTVALKMILTGHLATSDAVKRFRAEAVAAARLDHPHIVPVFEVGEQNGLHYFSMKLIRGESLATRLQRGPLPPGDGAAIIAKIARAIGHAHSQQVLHRDIKPGNILLDGNGEPHVADFGLAKLFTGADANSDTRIAGTPAYLAPEHICGEMGFTPAADIYSLGVVFYEMLSGRLPFSAAVSGLMRRSPASPERLISAEQGIDADIEAICFKCLEFDPRRRYATAMEFAADLENWLAGRPVAARRMTPATRAARWLRGRPAAAALIGTAAFLLAAFPWAFHLINEAREEKREFVSSVREEKIRELQSLRKEWAKLDVPFVSIASELRSEIWKAKSTAVIPELQRERYTIGIYAHENPVETAGQFAPFLAWLENSLCLAQSNRVRLDLRIYKDNRAARQALVHGAVDIVRLGAGPFLMAQDEVANDGRAIELIAKTAPGRYEATLFVRAGSGIRTLAELKGRALALGDPESTISGFHIPALLAESGLGARDLRVEFHRSHTESVNQVLRGKFEAGVAKTPLFLSHKERGPGLIALTNVTCISMPWAARTGLPLQVVSLFKRTLLNLKDRRILELLPDKPTGFEPATAAEYEALREHRGSADQFFADENNSLASTASKTTKPD
jgi:ABC-type phosphate/phosphonate transport system substrate-binding protein